MSKFLKTSETPFTKGRWYKIFCESDGTTQKITTKEIEECTISNTNHLNFPHDLRIVDILCDFHNVEFDTGTANINNIWYALPNGAKYILLPSSKSWDYGDVWVFGYRTGEA